MFLEKELKQSYERYGIREEDLEEVFVRSTGPGGQNVNKVSTCVALTHRPSGIYIKCQSQRTQAQNRLAARWLLVKKIQAREEAQKKAHQKKKFLSYVQKKKRPQFVKEKILLQKKKVSEKKKSRGKIRLQKSFED